MGNKGLIRSGDVQWMTAGSGIIHQEMPKGQKDGLMWGFQLWANLPASHKMMAPRYRDAIKSQIPEVITETRASVRIICGQFGNTIGPIRDIVIDPEYLDVTVPSRSQFRHTVGKGQTLFAYVIEGAGCFDERCDSYAFEAFGSNYFDFRRDYLLGPEYLVTFSDGDEVIISTEDQPVRFLLISGKPIKEPIAWYGPIVMNTQEELRTAFDEYQKGTFIK